MFASDVMDEALVFLNDSGQSLYTYAVQLPYLKRAQADLEKLLATSGIQIERTKSSAISVLALARTLTLPSDFFLPIDLKERFVGETDAQWIDMVEKSWEPDDDITGKTYLEYWAFRNNAVYLRGCNTAKEVLMRYERNLTTISSQNSVIDTPVIKQYLSARTAELCARYIGMNANFANDIRDNEVGASEDSLIRSFVLQGQSVNRARRLPFSTGRLQVS